MLSKHSGKTGKWFPKRSLRRRILWLLSCLVVFCTTYALILPAITLANETYCHLDEHQHDENCFRTPEPLCNQESPESGTAPPHEHDDSCYDENQNLICDKQEQTSVHQHTDECYRSDKPLCGKEEHTHSKMCYSNQEDVEKKEDWEKTLPKKLDGTTRENLISVAESQIGYNENETNFILDSDENVKNYSRYGEWYGKPYEDWNLMFLSFLLHYSEISDIPYGYDWKEWKEDLKEEEIEVQNPEDLEPGDIVLFHLSPENEKELSKERKVADNYIGVISSEDPERVITGDWNGKVTELEIKKEKLVVDGTIPYSEDTSDDNEAETEEPDSDQKEAETKPEPDGVIKEDTDSDEINSEEKDDDSSEDIKSSEEINALLPEEYFQSETEDFFIEVKPILAKENLDKNFETSQNSSEIDSDSNNSTTVDIQINDEFLEDGNSENSDYQEEKQVFRLDESVEENDEPKPDVRLEIKENNYQTSDSEDEEIIEQKAFELQFFEDGKKVNLDGYLFQINLTPKSEYIKTCIDKANTIPDSHIEEVNIQLVSNPSNNKGMGETSGQRSAENAYNLDEEIESVSLETNDPEFSTRTAQPLNYSFSVQTYAYLEIYESTEQGEGSTKLDRIRAYDQSGTEKSDSMKFYPLKQSGDFYQLKTRTELTQIYTDGEYFYHNAPNLNYFNKLIDNSAYDLQEIWVLKDKKSGPDNIDKSNWEIYSEPAKVKFLNRDPKNPAEKPNTIIISEGTIIRLVYNPVKTKYESPTQYFDYDETDGKVYKSNQKDSYATKINDTKDGGLGINSKENYQSNPTAENRFAFGQNNTGISDALKSARIGDRYLNIGNRIDNQPDYDENTNYSVFNIVTGLDSQGNPVFNEKISAPDLFSNDAITGKTVIQEESILGFNRSGDTYTLSSSQIGATQKLENLEYFTHPKNGSTTYSIWTNHFWPLDKTDYGLSQRTGGKTKKAFGSLINGKFTSGGDMPASDNGVAHNNLFGMKFSIDFTLDGSYVGPLRYFFFGDDDLWVFLDGQLIADLGGVKQSKGVYVDIREKMKALGKELTNTTHTLSVFYTERGLSGSTCFMEFTLPQVSNVGDPKKTGGFKLQKQTFDGDEETEFAFNIKLLDEAGNLLGADFAYTKHKEGSVIEKPEEGWLILESDSNITLKKNEYIVVKYLPLNSKYKITEILPDGDQTEVTFTPVSTNSNDPPNAYTGVVDSSVPQIVCTNKRFYKLPETGGFGINRLMISGGVLIAISSTGLIGQRWKRRRYK